MNSVFLSGDKQAPVHRAHSEEKKLAGHKAATCMFSYFFFTLSLYPPPLLFFWKPPKKRLIMKGKLNFTL